MQSVRLALVVLALASLAAAGDLHRRSPNAFQKNAVKFHFFHTGNWLSQTGITLPTEYSQEDILNCKFDPKLKTVVIIHGFAVSVKGNSMQTLKNAYFTGYGRLNLIVLDWSALNPAPFYPLYATGNISGTGKILAALLDFLVQEGLLDMAKVHVLGHSLGAHVAGVAGENVVNGRIGRITGLDPARPLINIADPVGSLSPDDATLVDVLHSNAGILGSMPSLGDIDFYPNGGKAQPGCDGLFGFVCSHSRSYYLWAESIVNPQAFRAWRCQDEWDALHLRCPETNVHAYMGEHISFSQAGDYFVETNAQSPFGLNLTSSQASS